MGGESKPLQRASRPFSETFAAPLVLGGLFTVAFYGGVAVLPTEVAGFFDRYFCSHPLEYATTALFFVAIGTLLLKSAQLTAERAEFKHPLTSPGPDGEGPTPAQLEAGISELTAGRQRTWLIRRLADACAFVRSRGTASGIEEHLKYLGELAADQLHRSYALVRTITWAVPILGFLGTVIGITMAIANVTPEQLDSSLGEVTSGLAVAFDTTALALALSIVLVFASFLVERSEQQLLSEIEDFSMRDLPRLFGTEDSADATGIQTETAQALATALDGFVSRQLTLWDEQLGQLRTRWDSVLTEQTDALTESLSEGMAARLSHERQELKAARSAFAETFGQSLDNGSRQMAAAVETLERRIGLWQYALDESSTAATAQLEALQQQGETLLKIAEQENQLVRLEEQLCSNLEAIRISETFDQTLNNLTAAVHLLSARAGHRTDKAA